MPEKSLKEEDLMERLGNIFSHLSNGYKNLPELIPYSCSTHMHRVGSFTSTFLLCVLYISICKSSLIIHVHSLASGFSVSINFFLLQTKSVEPSDFLPFSSKSPSIYFLTGNGRS